MLNEKLFNILESFTFLAILSSIILSFFISNNTLISTYENMVNHTLNKFTVEIILLFEQIMLIIGVLIIFVAMYLKSKKLKLFTCSAKTNIIGILLPITVLVLIQLFFTTPFLDDSFISFRYAKNLFETGKATFNIYEEPVEGYTHPLWIVLLLIPQFLKTDIFVFAKLMGLFFSILGLILVYVLSNKNPAAAWLYALSASVAGWTMTGLETPMYTAASLFFIFLFLKEKYLSSSLILFLVTLTRPEGVAFFVPAIFILIKCSKHPAKNLFTFTAPFLTLYAAYMAWKYKYFGYLLPNTFHAKNIFLGGIPWMGEFILFISPMIILLSVYFIFQSSKQARSPLNYLFSTKKNSFITLCILFAILPYLNVHQISGFYHRFFQLPLILIFIISSGPIYEVMHKLLTFANKKNIQLFALCLITLFFITTARDLPESIVYFNIHYAGLEKAHIPLIQFLNQQYQNRNYTIALSDIGAISYNTNFSIIDIQGLTDKVLSKGFNSTYVLERNPEIIILDSSSHTEFMQADDVYSINNEDLILYQDPRFQKKYVFLNKTFEHTPTIILWPFVRRDVIE